MEAVREELFPLWGEAIGANPLTFGPFGSNKSVVPPFFEPLPATKRVTL